MIEIKFEKVYDKGWDEKFKSSFDKTYNFIQKGKLDLQGVVRKLEISSKRLEDSYSLVPHVYGIWSGIKDNNFSDVLEDDLATQLFIETGLLLKEKLGENSHKNIFFDQLYTMMYGNNIFSKVIIEQDENHGLSTSAYDNYISIINSLYSL